MLKRKKNKKHHRHASTLSNTAVRKPCEAPAAPKHGDTRPSRGRAACLPWGGRAADSAHLGPGALTRFRPGPGPGPGPFPSSLFPLPAPRRCAPARPRRGPRSPPRTCVAASLPLSPTDAAPPLCAQTRNDATGAEVTSGRPVRFP